MTLSQKILSRPVLVLIVFVLLSIMGMFTLGNLAISLMPDIDSPFINVNTTYKNAGPESVEKSVTRILEGALVSTSGLKTLTSTSSEGRSSISLEFNYGKDLDVAVNDIRDKLDRVKRSLPDDADTPTIFKMDADARPIMRLAVRGNRTADDLREIAEDDIADILEQADGVAEASVRGGSTKIVRVELEQNRLAAYGLTVSSVSSALSKQNIELGGGKVSEGSRDYFVRTTGEYTNIGEVNACVVATVGGKQVRLRDVGRAFMGTEDINNAVYINGEPGVYISLTKQSGSNSVAVANNAYKKIEEAQSMVPSDITIEIVSDDTDAIRETIATLIDSAWQGLILAVVVLFIFLQNFKSTIIISISIPLSMLITMMAMHFAGITLNMMTLTGLILGLGMIVDASIVIIENIYSYRSRGARPSVAASLGSAEMVMSVLSGNLTTICVFIPFIFFIGQLEFMGQLFKGIIFTIVIALVSSLLVAIFLVPVLAGHFLPLSNRTEKPVTNPVLKALYASFQGAINAITRAYRRALDAAMRNRAVTLIVSFCLLASAFMLIPTMHFNMMGNDGGDDSVTLNITMPTGTSFEETRDTIRRIEEIAISEVKGYKNVIATVGGRGRQGNNTYTGSLNINLPKTSLQIDSSEAIKSKLRSHFGEFPAALFNFSAGRMKQMSGSDLEIDVRSDDLQAALDVADSVKEVMEGISDIGEVTIDTEKGLPQVELVVDRQRAAAFGIDIETVAREVNAAMNGTTSTVYRVGGKEYDIIVMYRPADRKTSADIDKIYVKGQSGYVSVANFARFTKGLGPVSIKRENQTRKVKVTADIVSDRNASVVEGLIQSGIAASFVIPEGVSIAYEGSLKDMKEQGAVYLQIALMALILVFGVMAATYESFRAPLINMMTIPFLIIGVVLIYKLTGQPLSMTSMVGLIMLVGIVVNNGIILVDATSLLVERGKPLREACVEAGASRLRPVLMTTLTTVLGTLPMCFQSEGSSAMVQPIGLAIVGGLTSSTFVTLFVIPVMYSLVMRGRRLSPPVTVDSDSERRKMLPPSPSTVTVTSGVSRCLRTRGERRVEIVANLSVQDDIIEAVERAAPEAGYTIVPVVTGKAGKASEYKLGTATWPEQNFVLLLYAQKDDARAVRAAVLDVKRRFPKEGIKVFVK